MNIFLKIYRKITHAKQKFLGQKLQQEPKLVKESKIKETHV